MTQKDRARLLETLEEAMALYGGHRSGERYVVVEPRRDTGSLKMRCLVWQPPRDGALTREEVKFRPV